MISIAIDGPSGSGKSTVSKLLAKRLGFISFDTGALYRAIACFFLSRNIDTRNENKVSESLREIKIDFKNEEDIQKMYLNGEDITSKIRTSEISMLASDLSAIPAVRDFLLETQRNVAKNNNVIMDGRDIGTIVLPFANVKIFLTAPPEIRAQRRFRELKQKDKNITYEEVLYSVNERDFNDTNRKIAPLVPAKDAVIFDNSAYTLNETANFLYELIRERANFEGK